MRKFIYLYLMVKMSLMFLSDYVVEEAKTSVTTKDDIINRINKLGDTVYIINTFDLNVSDNIFVPNKIINDLKRDLV